MVNVDGEKEEAPQLPGPGDYNIEVERPNTKQASSMFVSKVQRSGTGNQSRGTANRNQLTSQTGRGISRSSNKFGGHVLPRPSTTAGVGSMQEQIDIFEDENDGDVPGPGAYHNPRTASSFKTGKIPERLQFFGSTVDRFGQDKTKKSKEFQ